MKPVKINRLIVVFIIIAPLLFDQGCKKQQKCGCGKDVIFEITKGQVIVSYIESSKTAYFLSSTSYDSYYYFCNPGRWIDTLKILTNNMQGQELLVWGKAYYECTYLMNSGNYGYYIPPTYQVEVTRIEKNNYSKK
jgi:hypothetical protein